MSKEQETTTPITPPPSSSLPTEYDGCHNVDDDDDMEDILKKSFVSESKEIMDLAKKEERMTAHDGERLCEILDKYQECATLLDPILEQTVTLLMRGFVSSCLRYTPGNSDTTTNNSEPVNASARCLYGVVKARGQSVPSRFFPHTVQDIATSLAVLERLGFFAANPQGAAPGVGWEARYITMLWVSCLVLIPFDLGSFGSSSSGDSSAFLGERLLCVGKACLGDPGRTGTAAALLLARLLTRPDMVRGGHFAAFVAWCCAEVGAGSAPPQRLLGVLQALFFVLKIGQRGDLLSVVQDVFAAVKALRGSPQLGRLGITGRKYLLKIVQRVGLVYLKARVPTWRYRRGNRFLFTGNDSQAKLNNNNIINNKDIINNEEDDELIDVPEECEEVFDILLEGVGDRDSVARWSAAKGLGRLTGRLPLAMADDVVGSILECFDTGAGDASWHGGCLAVAELARRGLLVPARLGEVVPLVVQALEYDEARGSYSVGANVRDAACYVAWAFARAYAPEVMRPHVPALAGALVATSLFDREVNCRRAAAAAFQEHVGRQGAFPHGIEVITAADYFTLANRASAYLSVAPRIAAFPEYRAGLLAKLLHSKLCHWDKAVRALAAKALPAFLALDPCSFVSQHIPALIPQVLSSDPAARHGALLALAEVLPAAAATAPQGIPPPLAESLAALVPAMEEARLFRGRGTELVRTAACRFIQSLSDAHIPLSTSSSAQAPSLPAGALRAPLPKKRRPQVLVVQDVINDCLFLPHEELQGAAAAALRAFLAVNYVRDGRVVAAQSTAEKLISECYCKRLASDPNPAVRRGCALALGCLPPELCVAWRASVIPALVAAAAAAPPSAAGTQPKEMRDAETRRNAVRSLTALCSCCAENGGATLATSVTACSPLPVEDLRAALTALCTAARDYAADSRGDVGSWVREAALAGIPPICRRIAAAADSDSDTPSYLSAATRAVVAQLGQKIERMRGVARTSLEALVADPPLPVPCREEVRAALAAGKGDEGDGEDPIELACRLLDVPELRGAAVESLSLSVAAGEGSPAARAVLAHLSAAGAGIAVAVAGDIVELMRAHPRSAKFSAPFMATFAMVVGNGGGCGGQEGVEKVCESFAALAGREIAASSDIARIFAARDAALAILGVVSRAPGALALVASLLGHPYPRVRKTVAEKLYAFFLINGQGEEDDIATVGGDKESSDTPTLMDTLALTPWVTDSPEVAEAQRAVVRALGVDQKRLVQFRIKNASAPKSSHTNDLSYAQFIRENSI